MRPSTEKPWQTVGKVTVCTVETCGLALLCRTEKGCSVVVATTWLQLRCSWECDQCTSGDAWL
mgnify:CR=1 FL=1